MWENAIMKKGNGKNSNYKHFNKIPFLIYKQF